MPDRRGSGGADRRRQRRGEDEARRVAEHLIADRRAGRDVAGQAAERFGEGASSTSNAPHQALRQTGRDLIDHFDYR